MGLLVSVILTDIFVHSAWLRLANVDYKTAVKLWPFNVVIFMPSSTVSPFFLGKASPLR